MGCSSHQSRALIALWLIGCNGAGDQTIASDAGTSTSTTIATALPGSTADGSDTSASGSETSGQTTGGTDTGDRPPKLDVAADSSDTSDACGASGRTVPCTITAPVDSFVPDIQWSWTGPDGEGESIVIPLVANLTDDNGDTRIDTTDVPDVVVLAGNFAVEDVGFISILDGATGSVHYHFDTPLRSSVTPALGDIDNDGLPEIVALGPLGTGTSDVVVFEHDGTVKWTYTLTFNARTQASWTLAYSAFALADLDADGDVEILLGNRIIDHTGTQEIILADDGGPLGDGMTMTAVTAADLDDDGDLEVITSRNAWHHDGTPYYQRPELSGDAFVQVADLDGDCLPEVLLTASAIPNMSPNQGGLTMLEHDGTPKFVGLATSGVATDGATWRRPACIHDFDGDDVSEYAACARTALSLFDQDGTARWTTIVSDASGAAGSTAFDFLGDASAEVVFGDEHNLYVYDELGTPLLTVPRSSMTNIEYPVVVDVDNDGAAEMLIVSSQRTPTEVQTAPTLQVVRDVSERWVPARRIWNQHTYHVTNVYEDGTIPRNEIQHWHQLNTFRTQAQVEDVVCQPPPPAG